MDNIYQPLILSIYDTIKKLNIILSLAAFFDFDKFFVGGQEYKEWGNGC